MKTLLSALSLVLLLGCATGNQFLNIQYFTMTIADSTRVGIDAFPEAKPGVAIAREVICAAASKTNINPDTIVASLKSAGVTNNYARLIVDGGLIAYSSALNLVGTNIDAAEPYLKAFCDGLTQALPTEAAKKAMRKLPPHL